MKKGALDRISKIIYIIIGCSIIMASAVSFAWSNFVRPKVVKEIATQLIPIQHQIDILIRIKKYEFWEKYEGNKERYEHFTNEIENAKK